MYTVEEYRKAVERFLNAVKAGEPITVYMHGPRYHLDDVLGGAVLAKLNNVEVRRAYLSQVECRQNCFLVDFGSEAFGRGDAYVIDNHPFDPAELREAGLPRSALELALTAAEARGIEVPKDFRRFAEWVIENDVKSGLELIEKEPWEKKIVGGIRVDRINAFAFHQPHQIEYVLKNVVFNIHKDLPQNVVREAYSTAVRTVANMLDKIDEAVGRSWYGRLTDREKVELAEKFLEYPTKAIIGEIKNRWIGQIDVYLHIADRSAFVQVVKGYVQSVTNIIKTVREKGEVVEVTFSNGHKRVGFYAPVKTAPRFVSDVVRALFNGGYFSRYNARALDEALRLVVTKARDYGHYITEYPLAHGCQSIKGDTMRCPEGTIKIVSLGNRLKL